MKSNFKLTIPKPCHKNWNQMTPTEKGRFCNSCSKTVVDFTKKTSNEITDYIIENRNQQVCGHFYKKQLDTITIEIPQVAFQQPLTFQKLFILTLFFVMGTTLFSCQYSDGKKQKIENVILIDTINKMEEKIDSLKTEIKQDTIVLSKKRDLPPPPSTTGIIFCETTPKKDSIIELTTTGDIVEVIETVGELEVTDGLIDLNNEQEEIIMGFISIDEPPRFKESKKLSKEKAKEDFDSKMKKFVEENFDKKLTVSLNLDKGIYKIYTQFQIDTLGKVAVIKVRAPHSTLKEEVTKMLQKLPKFIPGKHRNKAIKTSYTLPISFEVE